MQSKSGGGFHFGRQSQRHRLLDVGRGAAETQFRLNGGENMKKADLYRFTLQWRRRSEEQIRAGDFLESLGNRKSAVIVSALCDYLDEHPDLNVQAGRPQVIVQRSHSRAELESIVRSMIEEKLASLSLAPAETQGADVGEAFTLPQIDDLDVGDMLDNLDAFI